MQAYEFYSVIDNGVIQIPEEYRDKLPSKNVKVILLSNDAPKTDKRTFSALRLNTKGFRFNREEANER